MLWSVQQHGLFSFGEFFLGFSQTRQFAIGTDQGTTISFPEDISRARQKLFRFLDNRFDSEQYRENVRLLIAV